MCVLISLIISVESLKFVPKQQISYFQPISAAIFVAVATVKVDLIQNFYTGVIVLIKQ